MKTIKLKESSFSSAEVYNQNTFKESGLYINTDENNIKSLWFKPSDSDFAFFVCDYDSVVGLIEETKEQVQENNISVSDNISVSENFILKLVATSIGNTKELEL